MPSIDGFPGLMVLLGSLRSPLLLYSGRAAISTAAGSHRNNS